MALAVVFPTAESNLRLNLFMVGLESLLLALIWRIWLSKCSWWDYWTKGSKCISRWLLSTCTERCNWYIYR